MDAESRVFGGGLRPMFAFEDAEPSAAAGFDRGARREGLRRGPRLSLLRKLVLALAGLAFFASCGTAAAATNVSFKRAWGWGVLNGANKFETCTTTCQAGIIGGGAGEFDAPLDVVADGAGHLFVADGSNYRVAEFSLSGPPIKAWGWGVKTGAKMFQTCTTSCRAGISGGGAGQLGNAAGVAVDSSGHLYVADANSNRVDEFSSTGVFLKAWGWGVKDGASKFQTCTASCRASILGGEAGEFNFPTGVATDRVGHVFIADGGNNRVDEFSSSGTFLKAWGWGVENGAKMFQTCTTSCQAGIPGGGAGQLEAPSNLAVNNAGHLLVADIGNNRIDEFSSTTGVFLKAWGWGVKDSVSKLEACTTSTSCVRGIAGADAGQLSNPTGVGTDSVGHVFVADEGNDRIAEYSSTGAFITAFGWGVRDGASKFETCRSSCQTGIRGAGAGQFFNPYGVRTDGSGRVYVADAVDNRIDTFTPPLCVVPQLKGKTLTGAETALKKTQCALGKVTNQTSAGPAGIVLSQTPNAGTQLPAGSKVAVVVSKR